MRISQDVDISMYRRPSFNENDDGLWLAFVRCFEEVETPEARQSHVDVKTPQRIDGKGGENGRDAGRVAEEDGQAVAEGDIRGDLKGTSYCLFQLLATGWQAQGPNRLYVKA
ncbi:MAG: hypothetical protein Q9192_001075 [Flavoplaca navasiana]